MAKQADSDAARKYSPYLTFTRDQWAALSASMPLTLSENELEQLKGLNERISLAEVEQIYLPLARLLHMHAAAAEGLYNAASRFLGSGDAKVPYVIGIAGSVAVGKSTTARILQALLSRWPDHPKVDLVTTDGFLYPNRILEQRGLMKRKGFPESYDVKRLIQFLADVKSGRPEVTAPVYSHLTYDIVPGETITIRRPDLIIVEGINVLQTQRRDQRTRDLPEVYVSDFFDFSIYVDADEQDISRWYVERFRMLRNTAFQRPESYFHRYASLTDEEADQVALGIWREINEVNLRENIKPTRSRARLILEKGHDHAVRRIMLRKL